MNIQEFDMLVRSRSLTSETIREGLTKIFNNILSNGDNMLKDWINNDMLWNIIELEQADAFGTEGMQL